MVHKDWKLAVLISAMVPLMASCFTFFRTNYWISAQTNPIEFRFFDRTPHGHGLLLPPQAYRSKEASAYWTIFVSPVDAGMGIYGRSLGA